MKKIIILSFLIFLLFSHAFSQFHKNKYYPQNIKWKKSETEHFSIWYMEREKSLLPILAQFAEDAYEFNHSIFNIEIKKIPIILYPSPIYFSQTQISDNYLPPNVAGFATFKEDRVVVPFNGDINYFQELLFHEISHIFQYHKFFKNPLAGILSKKNNIPTWVFEGLSEHATQKWGYQKYAILRDAVRNGYLHKKEFFEKASGLDYPGYQQAHSMIDLLLEKYGEEKFSLFLKNLNYTLNLNKSLEKSYKINFSQFYHLWKNYLIKKFSPQKLPSIYDTGTLFPKNALHLFKNKNFYLTIEKNKIVRKLLKNEDYKDVIMKITPFQSPLLRKIAVSEDETYLAIPYYENNRFFIKIYCFVTGKSIDISIKDITAPQKISFYKNKLYFLFKKGVNSKLYKISLDGEKSELQLPSPFIDNYAIVNGKIIGSYNYGERSYIFYNKRILKIKGNVIKIRAFSKNSIFLLMDKENKTSIYSLNLQSNTIHQFTQFDEPIFDFHIVKDQVFYYIFFNKKEDIVISDIPFYTKKIETKFVYKEPSIFNQINYEENDFEKYDKKSPLLPDGMIYGLKTTEGKFLKVNMGFSLSNITREKRFLSYFSILLRNETAFDLALIYQTLGNKPNYLLALEKNTVVRNKENYFINKFKTEISYPLSIKDRLSLKSEASFCGFDTDNLNNNLSVGISYTYDSAIGHIYPEYGKRIFFYAGINESRGETDGEFISDMRFYYLPFLIRTYFRYSPKKYEDNTYIRGYDEYFTGKTKLTTTIELRTPYIVMIPGLYSNLQLPLMSFNIFCDAGIFSDNKIEIVKNKKFTGKASIGIGNSILIFGNININFDASFKTNFETTDKNPTFSFSILKQFY